MLLLALLTGTASCGAKSAAETTYSGNTGTTPPETTGESYTYPDVDYGGEEFRVLNFDQLWNMFIQIDVPEQNGEVLNDAVYNRNCKIEDKLNCKIVETKFTNVDNVLANLMNHALNTILAGEDAYDVMFLPVSENLSIVTDGYMNDFNKLPELNLDETWWDNEINSINTLNGSLYFASGSANLMSFEGMWCLFFNEKMMENLQLDMPYDLVRDGKWTIDKLTEYAKAGASLNGDESFAYKKDGKCVWGISSHQNSPQKFYFCAGESSVSKDEKGELTFGLQSERFYNVINKLAVLLAPGDGLTLKASNTDFDADAGGYVYVFTAGRSLFMTGEIKASQLMRSMESPFGIVPFPKYDEDQENYVTDLVSQLFYMTIPVTNTRLPMTATICEVLTHDSYTDVVPLYYNQTVEQKGLRNEDSIEMLELMRKTRTVDIGVVFGWETDLRNKIRDKLFAGDASIASDVASGKSAVEAKITKFLEFLNEKK